MIQLLVCLTLSFAAHAKTLNEKLELFQTNPHAFYNARVEKTDLNGGPVFRPNALLKKFDPSLTRVIDIKDFHRSLIGNGLLPIKPKKAKAPPGENDRAESLIDKSNLQKNIIEMDSNKLRYAELETRPWSADYWPIYKGVLGARVFDSKFPYVKDWARLFEYIKTFPFFEIFKSGDGDRIQQLSVSEKYDLLVGDLQGTLTKNMWGQGQEYYEAYGKVETWMGICHGWAAAAVIVPRPQHSVYLTAFDGKTQLKFNPSEIKGLISYLWSNTPYESRFIGGRCNYQEVKRDSLGRPLAKECFDTNPATWHLVVVNLIGLYGKSFVMDATADYEVWNQPVLGYSVEYFNPQTLKPVEKLQDAIVEKANFKNDKFAEYRSSKAKKFIGVEMAVRYVFEAAAEDIDRDDPSFDNINVARYIYDLELDEDGNIVGGEWYQKEHPDFLWTPSENAAPITYEDFDISPDEWAGDTALPMKWRKAAQWASQSGRVLKSIIEVLHQKSRE